MSIYSIQQARNNVRTRRCSIVDAHKLTGAGEQENAVITMH